MAKQARTKDATPQTVTSPTAEEKIQLYRLEYETAATRYENIYQAIWRIFSYLTALAAGILTFGKEFYDLEILALIAGFLMLFWFWSTFLPLDKYGTMTLQRLSAIETELSEEYKIDLKHFTNFLEGNIEKSPRDKGIHMFARRITARTSTIVFCVFLTLTFLWLLLLAFVICNGLS